MMLAALACVLAAEATMDFEALRPLLCLLGAVCNLACLELSGHGLLGQDPSRPFTVPWLHTPKPV